MLPQINTTAGKNALPLPKRAPVAVHTVFGLLQKLQHGTLTLHLPDGSTRTVGDSQGPALRVHLHNWKPFAAALKSGDIGFADSYIAGDWSAPDLAQLLGLLLTNRKALDQVIHGTWFGRLLYRLRHLLRRNTKNNSAKNIYAHYDLGNAFYRLWLDPAMNYSSAWFCGDQTQDLQQAQKAKIRRALQMARVQRGHRVLDIGCGWGALAEQATTEFGAHLTGVTLSTEQLGWARGHLAALGQSHQADLRLQDYRDIDDGPYDAICSIEMIEAVGREYWPIYFQQVARLLKPGGRACIQSIVIQDALFNRYIRSTDFIQQYIFPGGCLPCPSEFRHHAQAAGLKIVNELAFGRDYGETCRRWRTSFSAHKDDVVALGFDERFIRTWEFYMAYCEAGFDAGDLDVVQYTLER